LTQPPASNVNRVAFGRGSALDKALIEAACAGGTDQEC
jgi:hypothetical protein